MLSYVDFEKMCNVIKNFPELNQNVLKEDNIFPYIVQVNIN